MTTRRRAKRSQPALTLGEWEVVLALLSFGRPVLLLELVERLEANRSVLLQKLDRCGSKGWVEIVQTDSGPGARVLEEWVESHSERTGRKPSVAYRVAFSFEEAGRRQAERLLDEWQLCRAEDRRAAVELLVGLFSRQFEETTADHQPAGRAGSG